MREVTYKNKLLNTYGGGFRAGAGHEQSWEEPATSGWIGIGMVQRLG